MARVEVITGASRALVAALRWFWPNTGPGGVNHRASAPQAGGGVATIAASRWRSRAIKADVTVPKDVTAMVDEINQRWAGSTCSCTAR